MSDAETPSEPKKEPSAVEGAEAGTGETPARDEQATSKRQDTGDGEPEAAPAVEGASGSDEGRPSESLESGDGEHGGAHGDEEHDHAAHEDEEDDHAAQEDEEARRADKARGLLIVGLAFVVAVFISLWAVRASTPKPGEAPAPATTEGIMGWPDKVAPETLVGLARSLTSRKEFRGFIAEGVESTGTLDISTKQASVRYSFQSLPGEGTQPERKPGTIPPRSYCGRQQVQLKREGIEAEPDRPGQPCSARNRDALPDPACSTKQIWDYAIKQGIPKDSLARIEYFAAKSGPAWRFTVPGKKRFTLAADCKTELDGKEAAGTVL